MSCCGSITEYIGIFIEHHIKELGNTHPSYLQDTPDFLRKVENMNMNMTLPENAILVTMDISSLYTNISHSDGIDCTREALNERANVEIPSEFIVRLLELLLKYNIFEFNSDYY